MRWLVAALLLLPSVAWADWDSTLKGAFPSAVLVETFDKLQDYRTDGTGTNGGYKYCAGTPNTTNCPRDAVGNLTPWTYVTVNKRTFEFQQLTGTFAPGDTVTGMTSGATFVINRIWSIDGINYIQPDYNTNPQAAGLRTGEAIQTAGGAKTGKIVDWPKAIGSFGPNSWGGVGKSAQFNLGDSTTRYPALGATAMAGIGMQRMGAYFGDGTSTSGLQKVHVFHMVRMPISYFGSPPYSFKDNVLKFLDLCTGFVNIGRWGSDAERAIFAASGDTGNLAEYGPNYTIFNWKGGLESYPNKIFVSHLTRPYQNPAGTGTTLTQTLIAGPEAGDGVYPKNEWFAVEVAEDIGTKGNPDGSTEVWIYNHAGQQVAHQKIVGQTKLLGFDGHKYNKITFGGNRLYGVDQSTWDERYWVDDIIVTGTLPDGTSTIAETYFPTFTAYQAGNDGMPSVTIATPPSGTYTTAQSVVLGPSEFVTIYYTTDGSEPTTSSAVYSAPIPVSSSTTLRYFSVDANGNTEVLKSSTYTITPTYYVSPTGSGSNSGTSPVSPWNLAKVNSFSFAAGDTVRFASGDYGTTTLTPQTSGTAGNLITFTSQVGAATKPILRGGANLNGRSYIKIDGLDLTSSGTTVAMAGATYNIITNCNVYSIATSWSPTISIKNGGHYNKVTNNTISQASANNDIINLRNDADFNLIEGNSITIQNSHAAIDLEGYTIDSGGSRVGDGTSNWNIIRGNTITGHNGGGAHITLQANANYNTVDNNVLKGDNTLSGYCNLTYPSTQFSRHQGIMKGVGNYNIIRNNIIADYPCKDSLGLTMAPYVYGDGFVNNTRYAHVYSNVITGIGVGATPLYLFKNDAATHDNNYFKNNILLNNGGTYWQTDVDGSLPSDTGNLQTRDDLASNFFQNNIIYKSGYSGALVWLGSNRYTVDQANTNSANWDGNLSVDPQLDAEYLPQAGSPALEAGANLTTITSASGSGTSFAVADAYYFTDGNGITTGDTIKVGSQTATITEISYGAGLTGTLTVTPAITWTQGDAVNLPFDGAAPSIGLLGATVVDHGGDTTAPTVTAFTVPATYTSITIPVTAFTATDDTAVTGYAITTVNTPPASWSATPPTSVAAAEGANTFYAWARDAAGNVSVAATDTVTVTIGSPEPAESTPSVHCPIRASVR